VIWIPQHRDADRQAALIAHLTGTIADCAGEGGICADPVEAAELASAVAAYLEQETGSVEGVDSGYLVLLAVQAMSSVGEPETARRLLVFGSGLVHPAEWDVTGGGDVWTLDLRRVMFAGDAPVELIFFNTLAMIVESLAEVWDATGGDGVLGLRHVYDSAVALLGEDRPAQAIRSIAREIRDTCRARLERAQRERGWDTVPTVMNLDL